MRSDPQYPPCAARPRPDGDEGLRRRAGGANSIASLNRGCCRRRRSVSERLKRRMETTPSVPALAQMKRDRRKIVAVVAWDYQMARIVDRVGVDIVSVGDTVGVNLWGQPHPLEITMDQMIIVGQAVRRG